MTGRDSSAESEQFEAPAAAPWSGPSASYRFLEPFEEQADDRLVDYLRDRLPVALSNFPELAGETINVGVLWEKTDASARAWGYNRIIELPPDQVTTRVTLYHELGHVAIRVLNEQGEKHPETSEEYCGIFAMARMPSAEVDEERVPYLAEPALSKGLLPHVCEMALAYREDHRDYIRQCNRWLTGEEDYLESPYHTGGQA